MLRRWPGVTDHLLFAENCVSRRGTASSLHRDRPVADDEPYQVEMSPDFQPWRRNVDFLECTETPIRPLIEELDFIEDPARWGYKFRFGVFKIGDHDFEVIRSAMGACGLSNVDTAPTEVACAFAIRRPDP